MKNSILSLPKRKAEFIEPMECAPVTKLLDAPGWFYEIKLDGYRAIAVKSGRVNLFSRRHKSFNNQYPYLVEALADLPEGTVVDGEVVTIDDSGRPNFNLLAQFRSEASRIHYFHLRPSCLQRRQPYQTAFEQAPRFDEILSKVALSENPYSGAVRGHGERHACSRASTAIRGRHSETQGQPV